MESSRVPKGFDSKKSVSDNHGKGCAFRSQSPAVTVVWPPQGARGLREMAAVGTRTVWMAVWPTALCLGGKGDSDIC